MAFVTPYSFLTTKPQKRLLSRLHPEWLYVLPIESITTPKLVAVIAHRDNSATSYTLIDTGDLVLRAGEVKCLDVSYARWDYDAVEPTKIIRSIAIRIESPDFEDQGAQDYIQYVPYPAAAGFGDFSRALYYHNSMGGLDSVICSGDHQDTLSLDGYMTVQPLEAVWDQATAQYRYADPTFLTYADVNVPVRPTREVFALKDLFIHKRAYEYQQGEDWQALVPIVVQGEELQLPAYRDNLKRLSLRYQYGFIEKAIDRQ